MKILMALSQLEVTGAEVYAVNVGDELINLGHEVFYASDTLTKVHNGQYLKFNFTKRDILNRIINLVSLAFLIKKYKIDVVHAHSRASAWICHIVCKKMNVPMIHTVHGRQPVHKSSKKFFPSGNKILAVCENIEKNLVEELGVPKEKVEVLRNGIDLEKYAINLNDKNNKIISIIGRLSGPKGEIAYELMDKVFEYEKYKVNMIGGKEIPEKFEKFMGKVNFIGYTENVAEEIAKSDIVIGAGRVALEALVMGKTTIAVGEAKSIGLINGTNLREAMESNFGDIGLKLKEEFSWEKLKKDIGFAIENNSFDYGLTEIVKKSYDLKTITKDIEKIYINLLNKLKK